MNTLKEQAISLNVCTYPGMPFVLLFQEYISDREYSLGPPLTDVYFQSQNLFSSLTSGAPRNIVIGQVLGKYSKY